MNKNVILIFVSTFLFGLLSSISYLHYRKIQSINTQSEVVEKLHNEIQSLFEIYIDELISGGIVTSEYFSLHKADSNNYEKTVSSTVGNLNSIYGINLLDHNGKIIRVYPYETNKMSLGKITQNIDALRKSFELKEEYWFSPPFDLYQGLQGFVIYIPIKKNEKLLGWIAPVISIKRFFQEIQHLTILQNYHVIIKDLASGKNYFTSNYYEVPEQAFSKVKNIRGREIEFLSWPRSAILKMNIILVSFISASLLAFFITYLYFLSESRQKNTLSMSRIQELFNFSIQDAASISVIQLRQIELLKSAPEYISIDKLKHLANDQFNLFNQINTLKKMIDEEDSRNLNLYPVLPFLTDSIEQLKTKMDEKEISLDIQLIDFAGKNILTHPSLFKNSVIIHLLQYLTEFSGHGANYVIRWENVNHQPKIIIRNENQTLDYKKIEDSLADRNITNIKRVMNLLGGDLELKLNTNGNISYELIF